MAERLDDPKVMRLLRRLLKTRDKQGIAQGDVLAPLLSNVDLTQVDRMLERAKEVTREGKRTPVEYARFADDLVTFIDGHWRQT
jgi:RNA-directed DNA polymerase